MNVWKSYMWTAEWRIKIIAVIYATFAAAKRKPEKKKKLVERCTGIAEVKGSNPEQAWIFFRLSFRKRKSCFYNCDDHPSFNFNDGKVMLLWANSQ